MSNPYESDELLQQYLVFHYGSPEQQFPYEFGGSDAFGFPQRCANDGPDWSKLPEGGRALDLGCAVGRSTFELARRFEEVIGIDFSQAFIDAGNRMKRLGNMSLRGWMKVCDNAVDLSVGADVDRSRVFFEQGDAQAIREDISSFDLVIACNLICRLPEPSVCSIVCRNW